MSEDSPLQCMPQIVSARHLLGLLFEESGWTWWGTVHIRCPWGGHWGHGKFHGEGQRLGKPLIKDACMASNQLAPKPPGSDWWSMEWPPNEAHLCGCGVVSANRTQLQATMQMDCEVRISGHEGNRISLPWGLILRMSMLRAVSQQSLTLTYYDILRCT